MRSLGKPKHISRKKSMKPSCEKRMGKLEDANYSRPIMTKIEGFKLQTLPNLYEERRGEGVFCGTTLQTPAKLDRRVSLYPSCLG